MPAARDSKSVTKASVDDGFRTANQRFRDLFLEHPWARWFVLLAGLGMIADRLHAAGSADQATPNIVLIVADGLGFSDLGCYGSEIRTRNLDQLARGGLRFSQFYNAGRTCPSRASIMTGLYPHQTGVGHMMKDYAYPGYRGNLNQECVTLAEVLAGAGYQTMMVGQWYLTRFSEAGESKLNWPTERGFEAFFGTIGGPGSYFDPPTLTHGKNQFRSTGQFYFTDAISDQAAKFIDQATRSSRKPFFLYVAYSAPHWPLHAPPEVIRRHQGKYGRGWEIMRQERYQRQRQLGLLSPGWQLPPRDSRLPTWEKAPSRSWHERRMEVYAAQVDVMDEGIGRILEHLRQVGAEQNTLVMFLSSNGATDEPIDTTTRGPQIALRTREGQPVRVGNVPDLMPGAADTFQSYGVGWAQVSNTPFRLYERSAHEGGIATPLIVSWPAVITSPRIAHDVGHVVDIMATCVDVARGVYPTRFVGRTILPPEGMSLLPLLRGKSRERGPIFWEHEGHRGVREGQWKLVGRQEGPWELYDMHADRVELNDLAPRFPVMVKDLEQTYEAWAKRSRVEPWNTGK